MIMWLYVHIVLIITGPYLIRVLAIACYECNQFPNESKSPCPATKTVNYGLMYDVSVFLMLYDYVLVAVTSSGILKVKQKLGVTFNSDKLGGIDFTKFSKLSMCSAGAGRYW